jgi:hypothetical protein
MLTIVLGWCCAILFLWALIATAAARESVHDRIRIEGQVLKLLAERREMTRSRKEQNRC